MLKKGLFLILSSLSLWGIARFCHHQTDGFCLEKLRNNTTCMARQNSLPLNDKQKKILTQKFHYLGRGLQSFSFLSDDRTTVLKIFNNRYQKRLRRLSWVPPLGPVKSWKEEKISYNKKKWALTFESYQIAYELLKKETGLLYFHPKKTAYLCPTTCLVDPLGIEHKIDLNQFGFILQKKVTLPYVYLENCAKQGEMEKARKAIHNLIELFGYKMDLGIADRDPLIRANCGFLDEKAIQIDIGPLSLDPTLKSPDRRKEEIGKMTLGFRHWLENHHPQMLPYFYEAIESL